MKKVISIVEDEKDLNELVKQYLQNSIANLLIIKEKDPNACVIMCSAMGQQAMVIEAIQSGAKDFIVKPFQAERVLEAVKKVIG